MDTNTNLLKSIQTMVQEQVNSAPYDKTRNAIVTANLTGGYYSIIMDGVEYPRVKAYGLVDNFTVNSTVKVVIPGNQASQMYITTNPGNNVLKGDSNINVMDKSVLLDFFYPIGTIYETADSTFNPATAWGGTWELIQGKVLVGAGTSDATYALGATGGESKHTLTIAELPSHTHSHSHNFYNDRVLPGITSGGDWGSYAKAGTDSSTSYHYLRHDQSNTYNVSKTDTDATATGSGNAHNNMPPYEVVNIWKRIA